ncbi:deoxynucleotidyltransferase terminal-interacting protein 2 [Melanerpes formicivorus]|uniref:deoxynucleotidyltransferase terminal-interacting protein 2 n=1 Tax=Melanerpes formicivorus TaxID=211600 RepID=UPI00358FD33F
MVATRRAAARRREEATRAERGSGSPSGTEPADASEITPAKMSTPVSVRMTRRTTKSICKPEVVQESQSEELEHAETRSNTKDSLEMQVARNDSTGLHAEQSVTESQADGDVSETESNCSAVSSLQTPLYVRVTRRRQIVVPYQPDYSGKKKHDKTVFLNKLSKILDEDDVSEAESCSSSVSGVQTPNVTRSTRSRQSKKKVQPRTVHEDISDAESNLSTHTEPSVITKRITRSMQIKSQGKNSKQTEKGNTIVSEDEDSIKDIVKSELVIIPDSRPAAELVPDAEGASVTEDNKESSSLESKHFSRSADASQSEEVKKEVLNDLTPSSLRKKRQSNTESPGKNLMKNPDSVAVDDSEEAGSQIQGEHCRILAREEKSEHVDIPLADCLSSKESLESPEQVTLKKSKKIPECKEPDVEADAQQSFTHADKLRKGEQSSAVTSPRKDLVVAQIADGVSRCSTLKTNAVSGEEQAGECGESFSQSSKRSSHGNSSLALFLNKDKSDESENCDVTDIGIVEENLCYKEAIKGTSPHKKSLETSSLHVEGLFVIDTEPGMSSSHKYYLDQVDQDSDAESKQQQHEKDEESSDLEEAGEELIDEEEKDEDDVLLEEKIDVLHLSSKIDPGLNIKKLGGLYISFDAKKQKLRSSVIKQLKEKKKDQLLQKSIITPDFEKKECVPPYRESLHQLKKQRRAEREKTAGDGWFGMKAPEITNELKNDLKVLKMRASLDPKHFYKKNDRDGLPKYFQVGTVVDSPIDFYHSRIPKKQRKRTIVDELLADSEFRRYNKKKYQEIMSEKAAFAAGKRNRKMKKFRN